MGLYPHHIAMSVVLTSILYATPEFNALQIIADSRKFDLCEPLIFHWNFYTEYWYLVVLDAAGLAILLDRGSNVEDPTSFLLLKTLQHNSILKADMQFHIVEIR